MKNKIKKQLNILMLTLMLATTGCSNSNEIVYDNTNSSTVEETKTDEDITHANTDDNVLYLNNYEEYKKYLSELNPSYSLLRKTIKENSNITGDYEVALLNIVDIFEDNKIDTHNLAIFYENLKKEVINSDYSIDFKGETIVGASFTPDPDQPCIKVDGENVDFATFLHEVIHSCHEVIIRVGSKYVYITSYSIEEVISDTDEKNLKFSGIGFIEGQTECITDCLYNGSKRLYVSSNGYNTANDIIDFVFDTQSINLNTFFSLNTDDFKRILVNSNIPKDTVNKIIQQLDTHVTFSEFDAFETRKIFYRNYIPAIIEEYIESGYTSKEIYGIIGSSLKTSIIEDTHNINDYIYYKEYINNQKELFDIIEEQLTTTLSEHDLETYSIYDFIGHEFKIYYSLYGKNVSLDNGNIYFAHNWDDEASLNSNILLYVENGTMKMCNYAENPNGSITCYDTFGELKHINNGISLKTLTESGIMTTFDGYLWYYYYPEDIKKEIISTDIYTKYDIDSVINGNSYLYLSEGNCTICSITKNKDGEEIAYSLFDNKIFLLPENAIKIGSLKELYENEIFSFDEDNNYIIDNKKLEEYIINKPIEKRR